MIKPLFVSQRDKIWRVIEIITVRGKLPRRERYGRGARRISSRSSLSLPTGISFRPYREVL